MNNIQAQSMFNKLMAAAQKSKSTLLVNLNKVEEKMAAKIVEEATVEKAMAEFREGVNAVKDSAKKLVVPPAETLRAYSGID